ncbi:MAG TPA: glycine--tRNA ligase [Acidimicrobiales bacterium]|nr:glycine--tRNA ligase [Acidimicrobiales bacterium]
MSEQSPTSDRVPEENSGRFDAIVNLAKRRGFVFPSAEIYGGIRSTYDYGPLGALMLRNVKEAWWQAIVRQRDDVVPIDSAIITNPKVWEASGHLETFADPLVDCRSCRERWRADEIGGVCPNCGSTNLTEARPFNLMFKTFVGPVDDESSVAYLRPETAQGMFLNFVNVMTTMRRRPPFGIAQLGRGFRNEITPGNFVFRTREFEMMELEFFVPPADAAQWFTYWCEERLSWYQKLGIAKDRLRFYQHRREELSHYSAATTDIEFLFPWGWGELEGIANRTDFDLKAHSAHSGVRLEYFDQATGERYTPHVIEPSAGATRAMMAFLLAAYEEDEIGGERRTVLHLHPKLAPFQVAVLPLSKKEPLDALAHEVLGRCRAALMCDYDDTQSIGRRYRRQDEIGTPFCVTVDFDSLEDNAVTIRERDSTLQARVPIENVVVELQERIRS